MSLNSEKKIYSARGALWTWITILTLASGACAGGREETVSPEMRFTEAAQTANARSTELFGQTPTLDPANLVATAAAPSPTAILEPTAAPVTPSPASTAPGIAPPASAAGPDGATYVADVTVPDDSVFSPGATFNKVWRIRNTGTTTWSTQYSLVFIDGETFGAPANVPIPNEVVPGGEVEIAVEMTAPEAKGSYTSYWKMVTPDGRIFGFGAAGNEAIWVKIIVRADAALSNPTVTGPAPVVSAVSLSVDQQTAETCPHTFYFTGQITLSKPASVTYLLEVTNQTGNSVKGPPPATRNLTAGQHPVVYELTIQGEMSGWAKLRVTSPVDLESNQVIVSLACG